METTRTILQVTQGEVEGDPDPHILSMEDNDRIITTIIGNKHKSRYPLRGVGARRCYHTLSSTASSAAPSTSMGPMTPTSAPPSVVQPPVMSPGLDLINRVTCYLVGKIDPTLYRQVTTKLYSILPQSQLEIVLPHIISSLSGTIRDDLFMEIVPQLSTGSGFMQTGAQGTDAMGSNSGMNERHASGDDDQGEEEVELGI